MALLGGQAKGLILGMLLVPQDALEVESSSVRLVFFSVHPLARGGGMWDDVGVVRSIACGGVMSFFFWGGMGRGLMRGVE